MLPSVRPSSVCVLSLWLVACGGSTDSGASTAGAGGATAGAGGSTAGVGGSTAGTGGSTAGTGGSTSGTGGTSAGGGGTTAGAAGTAGSGNPFGGSGGNPFGGSGGSPFGGSGGGAGAGAAGKTGVCDTPFAEKCNPPLGVVCEGTRPDGCPVTEACESNDFIFSVVELAPKAGTACAQEGKHCLYDNHWQVDMSVPSSLATCSGGAWKVEPAGIDGFFCGPTAPCMGADGSIACFRSNDGQGLSYDACYCVGGTITECKLFL